MKQLLLRFNALGKRERLGAILALVAVLYLVMDASFIGPQQKRNKAVKTELARVEGDLNSIKAELVGVKALLERDPHAKDRAQLDAYKKAMDDADAFLAKVESDPRQVSQLLRQIISSTPGVTLVSLKTLPATAVVESRGASQPQGAAAAQVAPRSVYRRGIEVTIKGNYLALLPYLEKLQRLPTRVLWSEADLTVSTYPDSTLRLTIYTLGTQQEAALG